MWKTRVNNIGSSRLLVRILRDFITRGMGVAENRAMVPERSMDIPGKL